MVSFSITQSYKSLSWSGGSAQGSPGSCSLVLTSLKCCCHLQVEDGHPPDHSRAHGKWPRGKEEPPPLPLRACPESCIHFHSLSTGQTQSCERFTARGLRMQSLPGNHIPAKDQGSEFCQKEGVVLCHADEDRKPS